MNKINFNFKDLFLEKYPGIKIALMDICAKNKNQVSLKEVMDFLKINYAGISEQDIRNAIANTKNIAPEKLNDLVKKVAPEKSSGFIDKNIRLEFKENIKGKDIELIIMEN